MEHIPVLLDEAIEALRVDPAGFYLDATFGRGGHAGALLARLGSSGRLYAMDRDGEAARVAGESFAGDERFRFRQAEFSRLDEFMRDEGAFGALSGVLMDLGVSSPQLDDPLRGFSFRADGPLDMRMDPRSGPTVAEWLATATEQQIADVLFTYGEERFARRIARAVVEARKARPILTTQALVALIHDAVPRRERHKDPATRSFQALRIEINNELGELKKGLELALEALKLGGRLVVISFHSLEDRIVKRFMREAARSHEQYSPLGAPLPGRFPEPTLRIVGKAVKPSDAEVRRNPRARSAILRVAEKIA